MVAREILQFFTLFIFKKFTDIPLLTCKIHGQNFENIFSSSANHAWAEKKK